MPRDMELSVKRKMGKHKKKHCQIKCVAVRLELIPTKKHGWPQYRISGETVRSNKNIRTFDQLAISAEKKTDLKRTNIDWLVVRYCHQWGLCFGGPRDELVDIVVADAAHVADPWGEGWRGGKKQHAVASGEKMRESRGQLEQDRENPC